MHHSNYYEVLIKIRDWTLERSLTSTEDHVGICHSKCPTSWMMVAAKEIGNCCDCDKQIPQDVLGLWYLYVFDQYENI